MHTLCIERPQSSALWKYTLFSFNKQTKRNRMCALSWFLYLSKHVPVWIHRQNLHTFLVLLYYEQTDFHSVNEHCANIRFGIERNERKIFNAIVNFTHISRTGTLYVFFSPKKKCTFNALMCYRSFHMCIYVLSMFAYVWSIENELIRKKKKTKKLLNVWQNTLFSIDWINLMHFTSNDQSKTLNF